MTVFDPSAKQPKQLFLDPSVEGLAIARFDNAVYPIFEKLTERQLSFMWREHEVDISRDKSDFKALSPVEQHIFTSNLKRQILLDSITARSPAISFLPLVTLPELETWIETWSFFETIHSRAYTHIIKNVYPVPSKILDGILDIQEIIDCSRDISQYYDDLILATQNYQLGVNGTNIHQVKKALYLAIMSANILEGVRFYVSFACSWAFAEQKKSMEGNAKIIKLIARDENIHLASTQHLLKILRSDDPDFKKIAEETQEECIQMFKDVLEQELAWAKFLFKDGSMIGLNYDMLEAYLNWLVHKRMTTIGLPPLGKGGANPLPWTQRWIGGSEVQDAPQETMKVDYTVGNVKQDISKDTFKGLSL